MILFMMLGGITTAVIWNGVLQFSSSVYEVFPGTLAVFFVYAIAQLFSSQINQKDANYS